jgi:hypothetical protein
MTKSYFPIFTNISTDPAERWELIRNFIESWYKISLSKTEQTNQIAAIEQRLGFVLPYSFQQYIHLSSQLLALKFTFQNGQKSNSFSDIFRDCFEVKYLKEHNAISLMIQGEADFYWAIKKADLQMDDPKVYGYGLDYECPTNEKFDLIGEVYPTITSFVLNHIFSYVQNGSSGGFGIQTHHVADLSHGLKSCFESHSKFDETEIFESENMIAFIQKDVFKPNGTKHSFAFHILDENKNAEIPPFVLELSKNKGWYYGSFIQNS